MFKTIVVTTNRNLFRSITFRLSLIILSVVAIVTALRGFHGTYDMSLNELIMDTDPRYVLKYDIFIQWLNNSVTSLLLYIVPFFSIIATVIILIRDYKDDFFEIEKAAGIKPFQYIFVRLLTLISIIYILSAVMNYFQVNLYVYTRGGVQGMDMKDYLVESFVRLTRIEFTRILPCITFYVCLTYLFGSFSRSAILSASLCMAYAITNYAVVLYSVAESGIFLNYLSHTARKLQNYMHVYDTEKFESFVTLTNTSSTDAALCISFLIGCGILFAGLCYVLVRKREQ